MILHDLRFYCLSDETKYLAIGCFLLASQHENRIPFNEGWIAKELSLTSVPNWQALLDSEFIQPIDCDASTMLATCLQHARQRREEKRREETESEILSLSQETAKVSGREAGASWPTGDVKAATLKESMSEASGIFKHWNTQSATMHHRAIDGQEKAILQALRRYSPAEILRAIERYSQVRDNKAGRYRDLYAWTLGEFLSRKDHYNVERFNAENWEEPFLQKAPKERQKDNAFDLARKRQEERNGNAGMAAKAGERVPG